MWATFIAQLLAVLGPVLSELLKRWLESLFERVSFDLPEPAVLGDRSAHEALFAAAIDELPRWAYARRTLLRALRDATRWSADLRVDAVIELREAAAAAEWE